MEMTQVKSCEVGNCAYNSDHKCRALAITIGDLNNPMCDTFCQSSTKGGFEESVAGVGACKVEACSSDVEDDLAVAGHRVIPFFDDEVLE